MIKFYRDNQSGFTLIEVLIAVVILTIGILSVNAMQLTSIIGNSKAYKLTEATKLGVDQIEQFMAMDYSNAALNDDNDGGTYFLADGTTGTADGSSTSPDGFYTIYWDVTDNSPLLDTKTITTFITWIDRTQKSLTMTLVKSGI